MVTHCTQCSPYRNSLGTLFTSLLRDDKSETTYVLTAKYDANKQSPASSQLA